MIDLIIEKIKITKLSKIKNTGDKGRFLKPLTHLCFGSSNIVEPKYQQAALKKKKKA